MLLQLTSPKFQKILNKCIDHWCLTSPFQYCYVDNLLGLDSFFYELSNTPEYVKEISLNEKKERGVILMAMTIVEAWAIVTQKRFPAQNII